ncbi:MAG: hypothetical protein IMF11_17590 [Proteobacteria bacterium]|nr:hypothetical protein [Pseudomonadota bacterium]
MGNNISDCRGSRRNRKYPVEDWYDEYEDYHGFGYGYEHGYRFEIDLHEAIDPLIRQIKMYDNYRQIFEKQGGTFKDLATLSIILSKEICLEGCYGQTKVALTDPSKVRSALYDIDYGLHLQVRELRSGMPCYYLCRIKDIYFSDYNSLVVEDLYCSPGYPMPDKRFVRLMKRGKEKSFLRLSPFREIVKKGIQNKKKKCRSIERETDRILYDLGRYVISPAWHEDQFPGMQAADHFDLTQFPRVIELLYLDLSGELCELRSQIDMAMLDFFQNTYPQPAILDFLKKLKDLNGAELNELLKEGLKNYVNLQKAFSHFLRIEIPWGKRKSKIPLNMLLLGNFSRLDLVGKAVNNSKEAVPAKKHLEKEARKNIRMITKKKLNKEEV